MKFILNIINSESIIKWFLGWVANIKTSQWEFALFYIKNAAEKLSSASGKDRKEYVAKEISKNYRFLSSFAINILIEVGVGYLKKIKEI